MRVSGMSRTDNKMGIQAKNVAKGRAAVWALMVLLNKCVCVCVYFIHTCECVCACVHVGAHACACAMYEARGWCWWSLFSTTLHPLFFWHGLWLKQGSLIWLTIGQWASNSNPSQLELQACITAPHFLSGWLLGDLNSCLHAFTAGTCMTTPAPQSRN